MHRFILNSAKNFLRSNFTSSCDVAPVIVTYHLTHRCNLNCFFCEHCGLNKNQKWLDEGELCTEDAIKLLQMLSKSFAMLYITGGEPFLRDDSVKIFKEMGKLPFKNITVNTNLTLANRVEACLPHITNLVVSIDSIDPDRFDKIRGVPGMGKRVLENLERISGLRKTHNFRLFINCVVTPNTINDARSVLNYCVKRGIKVGINAQNDVHGPTRDLLGNNDFKQFVSEIIDIKKKTKLISGTKMYYERMFGFQKYVCYPFLTPRINAKGELAYPCDNLNQWTPCILECDNWDEAVEKAKKVFGPIGKCNKICQFQCYIEPSLMVKKPWMALKEYFM